MEQDEPKTNPPTSETPAPAEATAPAPDAAPLPPMYTDGAAPAPSAEPEVDFLSEVRPSFWDN